MAKAKSVVANPDEPADPSGGGGFAEWTQIALILFRVELKKSLRETKDYNQRWMSETGFSQLKEDDGEKLTRKCIIHNLTRAAS